jgi:hypothetical protein
VGDGATDSTGKGESGVEVKTGRVAGLESLSLLDDGIELGRAGRLSAGSHCEGVVSGRKGEDASERRLEEKKGSWYGEAGKSKKISESRVRAEGSKRRTRSFFFFRIAMF